MYINGAKAILKENLEKIYGSNDNLLKNKILDYEFFEEDLTEALENILKGEEISKNSPDEIYALQAISAVIGKDVPYENDIKVGIETDYIEKFLKEDFKIKANLLELFFDNIFDFFIPNQEEIPIFSILERKDLQKIYDLLKEVEITEKMLDKMETDAETEEEEERFYAYEHIKGIKDNVDFCLKNNLEMIIFLY